MFEIRFTASSSLLLAFKKAHKSYELEIAILRVNRQVHRESSKVLYQENCWVFLIINFEGFADQLKAQGCPIVLGR